MQPTPDQIRRVAYFRWERRGGGHGHHHDDWAAAEEALHFAAHYDLIARAGTIGDGPTALGRPGRRVCRFCEQAEPRTRFAPPAPALPDCLGLTEPVALDQCDDCRSLFAESLDPPLAAFLAAIERWEPIETIPIAAYKALVRAALSFAPATELELFPDAVEWISNPDHDLDGLAFAGSGCHLHRGPGLPEAPWAALASRVDDDESERLPSLIFFAGGPGYSLQVAVPLGARDEDYEGTFAIPRVVNPAAPTEWRGWADCRFLPLAAAPARRRFAMAWAD